MSTATRQPLRKRLKVKLSKRIRKVRRPSFTLQNQSSWVQNARGSHLIQLTQAEEQVFRRPEFFGTPHTPHLHPVRNRVAPAVEMTWVPNARVVGGTNFVLTDGKAVHPDLYKPNRDISPIELYGQGRTDLSRHKIKIPLGIPKSCVPEAINLCDQTTGNYAHWLTETLPKLALIDQLGEYKHLPLLIDGWIHQNHLESLQAINQYKRTIIPLDMFQYINVGRVLTISPTSYCPHEYRDYNAAMQSGFQFYFSGASLNLLRDRLRSAYAKYIRPISRKIYVPRSLSMAHNGRHVVNIEELEDLIYDHGVETINLAGLNFAQQARIFLNASLIVAPTGAVLANMIFAKPGCRIIVLAATYKGSNYDYFAEMAQLLGHELVFAVGPQEKSVGNVMHRNYRIDRSNLEMALKKLTPAPEHLPGIQSMVRTSV